ncbi:unnamed protein product [Arctogadus glacialis]
MNDPPIVWSHPATDLSPPLDALAQGQRGPAVRFSSFEYSSPPRPPPLVGQHTVQVLREALSYSDEVIGGLLEAGAVAQNEQL